MIVEFELLIFGVDPFHSKLFMLTHDANSQRNEASTATEANTERSPLRLREIQDGKAKIIAKSLVNQSVIETL